MKNLRESFRNVRKIFQKSFRYLREISEESKESPLRIQGASFRHLMYTLWKSFRNLKESLENLRGILWKLFRNLKEFVQNPRESFRNARTILHLGLGSWQPALRERDPSPKSQLYFQAKLGFSAENSTWPKNKVGTWDLGPGELSPPAHPGLFLKLTLKHVKCAVQ